MKKIYVLLIAAMILTACAAPATPTQAPVVAPPEPTQTPVIMVQTVVVEATQVPTEPPTAAPVVVTVVVQPTQAPAEAPTQAPAQPPASGGLVALDNALGKGVFTNMTMTSSNLTLRCAPRDITFNITTANAAIVDVMFYYRIVDFNRQYVATTEYKNFGKMKANGGGNFTLTFSGEDVHPDVRQDNSWLDFQFIGLSKTGDVVDRSQAIEGLVKYTFDCP